MVCPDGVAVDDVCKMQKKHLAHVVVFLRPGALMVKTCQRVNRVFGKFKEGLNPLV